MPLKGVPDRLSGIDSTVGPNEWVMGIRNSKRAAVEVLEIHGIDGR
jgi:hypothetical protein